MHPFGKWIEHTGDEKGGEKRSGMKALPRSWQQSPTTSQFGADQSSMTAAHQFLFRLKFRLSSNSRSPDLLAQRVSEDCGETRIEKG